MLLRTRSLIALAVLGLIAPTVSRAQSPAELERTAAAVAALKNDDGGFAAKPGGLSNLGATSSAIRILKYTGGALPEPLQCIAYVRSCFDPKTGGFAPTPGGVPAVGVTATGLMAAAELQIASKEMIDGALRYFHENAKSFEDIRIAVAGLEAVKTPSPDFPAWTKLVLADRNDDGTFGKDGGRARATGSAAAALLRMGVALEHKDAVVKALKEAQRPDGGWSPDGTASNFETTYRIMRCFYMLREKPNVEAVKSFVAAHRNEDGFYRSSPSAESTDTGGTYFASIVGRWARELGGEPAFTETAGFRPLFNGRDLTGWEGDTNLWSVRDGKIVGTSPGIRHNAFLATEPSFDNFVFKATFRVIGDASSNSGIQFRSVRIPGTEMRGYQADVGQHYWACLYDESRRNKILVNASERAKGAIHHDGWNEYVIRCMGDQITLTLNGVQSVSYKEEDSTVARDGKIGFQIHAGGPMTVEFKNILIQPLPRVTADDSARPGFHLRTISTASGPRKYSVYLPPSYDGTTALPAVLFLHGSGERGTDGVVPAWVGIGPALLNHGTDFPAIVVMPQAQRSWAADGEDAQAALAALDDVIRTYRVDTSRVILTGLSMGGRGAWELAAAQPRRFSAVVPICGNGRTESAAQIGVLPTWCFVGDADRFETVANSRAMVQALRTGGNAARYTEYRGVGHNSWDRAYDNPALLIWMLAQQRANR